MVTPSSGTTQERLERLEQAVAGIQASLDRIAGSPPPESISATSQPPASQAGPCEVSALPPRPPDLPDPSDPPDHSDPSDPGAFKWSAAPRSPSPAATASRGRRFLQLPDVMRESEYWFNKIGIGLLLLGVVFLFKYSIDQGWITPVVRVACGLALGAGLLVIGLRIHGKRRPFSQVLLGGGVAVLYISGFAAFQLFSLVSHTTAMAFMVLVTVLAFALSLKQEEAMLSAIAAMGGLGTPFLLYTGEGDLPGLVSYTCLLLGGASAVYFCRGWRTLLWVCVCGGWAVLSIGLQRIPDYPRQAGWDRWALQLGVAFTWLIFAVVPVLREVVSAVHPARWPRPSFGLAAGLFEAGQLGLLQRHVHVVAASAPLVALAMSMSTWALPDNDLWGWIALGVSLVYGVAWRILKSREGVGELAYTHALTGVLLLTISLCLLLQGDTLLISLAAEALVLHLVARRLADGVLRAAGHILFVIVGGWLLQRLLDAPAGDMAVANAPALTDLGVIAVAIVVAKVSGGRERTTYRLCAHVAVLAWMLREIGGVVADGQAQGYVTIAWGVYAAALLVVGLRRNISGLVGAGVGTLLLAVPKLFFGDLVKLEAIWRVLLFLGFGGIFLVISYYFQALWRGESAPTNSVQADSVPTESAPTESGA